MRFLATIQQAGKTATGIQVPDEVVVAEVRGHKRRFLIPIPDARSPETRQRRIERTVDRLREGRL